VAGLQKWVRFSFLASISQRPASSRNWFRFANMRFWLENAELGSFFQKAVSHELLAVSGRNGFVL